VRVIRKAEFREGPWRNGLGTSWDIASDPADAGMDDFGWRFATARIDADVPFSVYPEVARIFTLIEGPGLELAFGTGRKLKVDRLFVPHPFACDVPTMCTLSSGPCMALNLFTRRGMWEAQAEILSSKAEITHSGPVLLFALMGRVEAEGEMLDKGDAAVLASGAVSVKAGGSLAYAARLSRL
jgi:uncharacterized protein